VARAGKPAKKNGRAEKVAGFETTLWASADKLRGNMDAAEYKHVALGLIFLKYISDRFEERRAQALADPEEAGLVDERDLYIGDNVFWVPEKARWDFLKANATNTDPTIGALIDQAMLDLEAENPSLKGVLTKNYARPELDQTKLGEVIKLFSDLTFRDEHHGQDVFGRVYDPCCGSGGMFVQSERFVEAHNGQRNDVSIFGQESNPTTWRLAKMNLAIRGIEANLGPKWADSFHEDLHPGLKADFVLGFVDKRD
jgi:type I restriction enzyme M protein